MYTLIIQCITLGIRLAAFFRVKKARLWVQGRRGWRQRYRQTFEKKGRVLWMHVASLGEFEQGRPLIEAFRERYPDWQIVLTFFSPSGYEIRKNYPLADAVWYLPADTHRNAADFLQLVRPDLAIFVKYEFWANYLFELKRSGVPTWLVSALFRPGQPFFRPWGGFWRRMLGCFEHIFVQNEDSAALLRGIGAGPVTAAGDTRVDRVLRLVEQAPENPIAAAFARGAGAVLVAGSTWEADEAVLLPAHRMSGSAHPMSRFKLLIAPHDPSARHLQQLEQRLAPYGVPVLRYSQATPETAAQARVLLIDNVGMLNTLYRYGTLAYIGGGFGSGIHNTLEPAAWGLPVLFGPRYEKFEEARQFVAGGGAFPVRNTAELETILDRLLQPDAREKASQAVRAYLEKSRGATERVMEYVSGF